MSGKNQGSLGKKFTSKSGKEIVFRYPHVDDLDELLRYINELSQENTYITFSGEIILEDEEMRFINKTIMDIEEGNAVFVLAFHNNKLIGSSGVDRKVSNRKRSRHAGVFGLSLAKDYRGEGIGYELAKVTIEEAKKNIVGLKHIILDVFANNEVAKSLYKKLGFKEVGRIPKHMLHKDEYIDEINMWLEL